MGPTKVEKYLSNDRVRPTLHQPPNPLDLGSLKLLGLSSAAPATGVHRSELTTAAPSPCTPASRLRPSPYASRPPKGAARPPLPPPPLYPRRRRGGPLESGRDRPPLLPIRPRAKLQAPNSFQGLSTKPRDLDAIFSFVIRILQ